MRLLIPACDPLLVKAVPVDSIALEAPAQLQPLRVSRIGVAPRFADVDPVLKGVDGCAVRKEEDDPLEQLSS